METASPEGASTYISKGCRRYWRRSRPSLSESGFQAGAIYAAQNTNITLTSLADFENNFPAEVSSARAKILDERIAGLMQASRRFGTYPNVSELQFSAQYSGPPGFPGLLEGAACGDRRYGAAVTDEQALEDARFNRWPVIYFPLDHTDGELFKVSDWEGLIFVVEKTLLTCERIYAHMTTLGAGPVDWRDLQPPDLVELLDAIRNPGPSVILRIEWVRASDGRSHMVAGTDQVKARIQADAFAAPNSSILVVFPKSAQGLN